MMLVAFSVNITGGAFVTCVMIASTGILKDSSLTALCTYVLAVL